MNQKPATPEPGELDQLYTAGRDIEPEPGLDRIIRARAEQAAGSPRSHRAARWLGGLGTAAALVLAVGVVLQQSAFESDGLPADLGEPAPSPERTSPAPLAESPPPRPSLDRMETRAGREAPVLRSRAADSNQPTTLGRQQGAETIDSFSGLAAESELSESESADTELLLTRAADMSEPELLDWITELLEQGDLSRAGQLLHYMSERQAEAEDR